MIYRSGSVISDGKRGKRVPAGFTDWHSDMSIDDIPGEECPPIPLKRAEPLNIIPEPAVKPAQKLTIRTEQDWYRFLKSIFGNGR